MVLPNTIPNEVQIKFKIQKFFTEAVQARFVPANFFRAIQGKILGTDPTKGPFYKAFSRPVPVKFQG